MLEVYSRAAGHRCISQLFDGKEPETSKSREFMVSTTVVNDTPVACDDSEDITSIPEFILWHKCIDAWMNLESREPMLAEISTCPHPYPPTMKLSPMPWYLQPGGL